MHRLNRINLILDQECSAIFSGDFLWLLFNCFQTVQKVECLNILNSHQVKIKTPFCLAVPKLNININKGSIFECEIKYFGHLENLGYSKFCQIV